MIHLLRNDSFVNVDALADWCKLLAAVNAAHAL